MNTFRNTNHFIRKHKALIFLSFFMALLILALPACNQDNAGITTSAANDNVSVGFFSEGQNDQNQIVITEAKFVLRRMTLEYEEGEHECDVKLGPFIVNLDLNNRVALGAIAKIPAGTYDAIKFHVHKPSPNDGITDPDFYENNSSRFSVVVKGMYNNVPFVYKSRVTVSKKIEFELHSVTVASTVVYITVRVNPYSWFYENGNVLDPTNEGNRHEIDENIKRSLKRAFRDMDLDGNPD